MWYELKDPFWPFRLYSLNICLTFAWKNFNIKPNVWDSWTDLPPLIEMFGECLEFGSLLVSSNASVLRPWYFDEHRGNNTVGICQDASAVISVHTIIAVQTHRHSHIVSLPLIGQHGIYKALTESIKWWQPVEHAWLALITNSMKPVTCVARF